MHETAPVWLPAYAVAEGKPAHVLGVLGLAVGLSKHLSGEAELERNQSPTALECAGLSHEHRAAADERETRYLEITDRRFTRPNRCC